MGRLTLAAGALILALQLGSASAAMADGAQRALPPGPTIAWQDRGLQNTLLPPKSARVIKNNDHDQMRSGVRMGQYVPLSDVLSTIRQRYPGKQLNTRMIGGGAQGPVRYEIKWLTPDGHRLDITADAKTGQILNVRGL